MLCALPFDESISTASKMARPGLLGRPVIVIAELRASQGGRRSCAS